MDDDIPYLLLTPGPLTTSRTVRETMLRDYCTWDDDYNSIVSDVRRRLVRLATTSDDYTSVLMQGSGTFGVEANADSAAAKIRRNGMAADVRELKTEDNTVWRVLVGPAATRAERKAIQNDVKDLGFTDAFTVSN